MRLVEGEAAFPTAENEKEPWRATRRPPRPCLRETLEFLFFTKWYLQDIWRADMG
jgi:hypothetical protein